MNLHDYEANYLALLGFVPTGIQKRTDLAASVDRLSSIGAIEDFRFELLHNNTLDNHTQHLVHLAMLIGAGEEDAASIHTRACLNNGITKKTLFGIAQIAAVVGGMPAFSRTVKLISGNE